MVLCLIVGCGSKCGRDNGVSFPKVIVTNKGEQAEVISINDLID